MYDKLLLCLFVVLLKPQKNYAFFLAGKRGGKVSGPLM
jgi:hypothetical protein